MFAAAYPVRVDGALDRHLSRWLWLVKWFPATLSLGATPEPATSADGR